MFSSPYGDFSFSMRVDRMYKYYYTPVFVPSRGFLFFYSLYIISSHILILFSSPHGDFSFSILLERDETLDKQRFRPLTGISLFL